MQPAEKCKSEPKNTGTMHPLIHSSLCKHGTPSEFPAQMAGKISQQSPHAVTGFMVGGRPGGCTLLCTRVCGNWSQQHRMLIQGWQKLPRRSVLCGTQIKTGRSSRRTQQVRLPEQRGEHRDCDGNASRWPSDTQSQKPAACHGTFPKRRGETAQDSKHHLQQHNSFPVGELPQGA